MQRRGVDLVEHEHVVVAATGRVGERPVSRDDDPGGGGRREALGAQGAQPGGTAAGGLRDEAATVDAEDPNARVVGYHGRTVEAGADDVDVHRGGAGRCGDLGAREGHGAHTHPRSAARTPAWKRLRAPSRSMRSATQRR